MTKRILIAEDDPITSELMTTLATSRGYDVTAVIDGVDLLEVAASEKFDVIITDLKMPNLNGASAVEIMKLQGSTIPVIVLTAVEQSGMDLVRDKFARIFHKPCNVRELFDYVDSLIAK